MPSDPEVRRIKERIKKAKSQQEAETLQKELEVVKSKKDVGSRGGVRKPIHRNHATSSIEEGASTSTRSSTSTKWIQEQKHENVEVVATTVKDVNTGIETTQSHTLKSSSSVKTTFEITNTVERCESAYVKRVQSEEMDKAKQPPLNLSVPGFAKMLGQPSTKGPFQPISGSPLKLTSSSVVNTRLFLERLLQLGAVPPECLN